MTPRHVPQSQQAGAHMPMDRELLTAALQHPEGVEPLFHANLECAAALYQVHPGRIEGLRARLPEGAARAAALSRVAPTPSRPQARPAQPRLVDAATLLALARHDDDERCWLLEAPVETAATHFGAHVFVVEEARRQYARA